MLATYTIYLILVRSFELVAERTWRRPRDEKGRYINHLAVSVHRPRDALPSIAPAGGRQIVQGAVWWHPARISKAR